MQCDNETLREERAIMTEDIIQLRRAVEKHVNVASKVGVTLTNLLWNVN